jgi:hypothetical protein
MQMPAMPPWAHRCTEIRELLRLLAHDAISRPGLAQFKQSLRCAAQSALRSPSGRFEQRASVLLHWHAPALILGLTPAEPSTPPAVGVCPRIIWTTVSLLPWQHGQAAHIRSHRSCCFQGRFDRQNGQQTNTQVHHSHPLGDLRCLPQTAAAITGCLTLSGSSSWSRVPMRCPAQRHRTAVDYLMAAMASRSQRRLS